MFLAMENCHGAIRQIIYQAAGISYRFSVVMCLAVKKLSWRSPKNSPQAVGIFHLQLTKLFFAVDSI